MSSLQKIETWGNWKHNSGRRSITHPPCKDRWSFLLQSKRWKDQRNNVHSNNRLVPSRADSSKSRRDYSECRMKLAWFLKRLKDKAHSYTNWLWSWNNAWKGLLHRNWFKSSTRMKLWWSNKSRQLEVRSMPLKEHYPYLSDSRRVTGECWGHVGPWPSFEEIFVVFDYFLDFNRLDEDGEPRRSGYCGISLVLWTQQVVF